MCLIYPTYFPNISNYIVFVNQEIVCFEVQDNYQKQTYRNRCYIYSANGELGLHIPIHFTQNKRQMTREVLIDNSSSWKKKHWKSIESAYKTSPFFEFYEDDIKPLFEKKHKFLLDYNMECIQKINECLELNLDYKLSTDFMRKINDNDFRFLAKKSKIKLETYPYLQVFKAKHGYLPNLSILDLLFNLGPESTSYLINHPTIKLPN